MRYDQASNIEESLLQDKKQIQHWQTEWLAVQIGKEERFGHSLWQRLFCLMVRVLQAEHDSHRNRELVLIKSKLINHIIYHRLSHHHKSAPCCRSVMTQNDTFVFIYVWFNHKCSTSWLSRNIYNQRLSSHIISFHTTTTKFCNVEKVSLSIGQFWGDILYLKRAQRAT